MNESWASAGAKAVWNRDGDYVPVCVVKASWAIGADGTLAPADDQMEPCPGPIHHGEPETSGLRYDTDFVPEKPGTDILIDGTAYSVGLRTRASALVGFRIGKLEKAVRVSGSRVWYRKLGRWRAAEPEAFEAVPLRWEKAFGGTDTDTRDGKPAACPQNPVGTGFRAKRSRRPIADTPLPQIEDPRKPLRSPGQRPPAAGLGPVAAWWKPRVDQLGTEWSPGGRAPRGTLPTYFSCAPRGQHVAGGLRGDEPVLLVGLTTGGRVDFTLPGGRPRVHLALSDGEQQILARLDTVIIEPDLMRLRMVWRATGPATSMDDDLMWRVEPETRREGG